MTGSRRERWGRAGRLALRGVVGVAVLLAIAWLLRGRLIHPWLIRMAERTVAERLDAELRIGALRSNWFTGAELEDVRWTASTGVLRGLDARRVRASWSLLGLATGSDRWLESIEGTVDSLALAAPPPSTTESSGEPLALPAHLPGVDLTLGALDYDLGSERGIALGPARLTIAGGADGESIALRVERLDYTSSAEPVTLDLITVAGRYDAGRLTLHPTELGRDVRIEGAEVDLSRPGQVGWSVAGSALEGAVNSAGKVVDGRIDATFSIGQLELGRLEQLLPGLELGLPPELTPVVNLNGSLNGRPTQSRDEAGLDLQLDWLEAESPALLLRGVGLSTRLGAGSWQDVVRATRGRVLVEANESAAPDNPRWAAGSGRPPLDLSLTAELLDGRAEVGGRVLTEGGDLHVTRGELRLGAGDALLTDALADLDLQASFTDLTPIGRALGLDWSGALDGAVEISGPLLTPTGRMTATASNVRAFDFELGDVDLNLVAQDGRIELLDSDVTNELWTGSASGAWIASEQRLEGGELELAGGGLALGPITPASFKLSVVADGTLDQLAGAFSLATRDLGLAGYEQLDLRGAGTFAGRSLRFDSLLAEDRELALLASGQVVIGSGGDFAADVDELELTGPTGAWRMTEPARVERSAGALVIDPLALASLVDDREGTARVSLRGRFVEAEFLAFELGPLRERLLSTASGATDVSIGGLTGQLSYGDSVTFDLVLEQLTASRGTLALAERRLDFTGILTPAGALEVRALVSDPSGSSDEALQLDLTAPLDTGATSSGGLLQPGPVRLLLKSGPLELAELGPLLGLPSETEGTVRIDADLSGAWSDLRGAVVLRGSRLASPESREAIGDVLSLDLSLDWGDRIELTSGSLAGPDGPLMALTGFLDVAPDVAAWAADPSLLADARLSIDGKLALPLEGWTKRVEGVRRLAGAISGDVAIGGTPRQPVPSGELRLENVDLRLASAVPSIRALNATLRLDQRRADIVHMALEFGGAPCTVTGGVDWSDGLRLDRVTVTGENLLIARNSTTRLRANLAPITIDGPLDALLAEGEVVITEGRFAQDVDLLSNLLPKGAAPRSVASGSGTGFRPSFARTGPLATMRFDLRVRSEGQLRIKGNLYDAVLRPEVTMRGTGEVPLFEGEIYVDPSTVSLPSGRLSVDSGVLRFDRDDPFRPNVTLAASMQTKGYDIDAQIDGPLGQTEILLSSSPALQNDQLLMLFLAGQAPATSNQGMAAAQTVGVYLAQDALVRWLGGGTKEADSLLDNLVFEIGADVTQTGAPTLVGRYYLGSRRQRTGRTTYLIAEKDVWDKTNFGFGIRFRFE